jgi:hypothetical protein
LGHRGTGLCRAADLDGVGKLGDVTQPAERAADIFTECPFGNFLNRVNRLDSMEVT